MGSGKNVSGTGGDCGFASGRQFIDGTEPNVDTAFSCAANVGALGNPNEAPMTAMARAVTGEMGAPGACNEGFLRDDAILVVTVVSDANPQTANREHAMGSASTWYDAVVAAKGGNEAAIVVVGLFGDMDLPGGLCNGDQTGPEYRAWVERFGPRGFLGSVCMPDYSALFLEAVSTIDLTCDEFEPEG